MASEDAKRPGTPRSEEEPGRPVLDLASRLALRPKEAAQVLGISERTFRNLLPELPHVRKGGVLLIPVDLLREWLREQARIEGNRVDAIVREMLEALDKDAEPKPTVVYQRLRRIAWDSLNGSSSAIA